MWRSSGTAGFAWIYTPIGSVLSWPLPFLFHFLREFFLPKSKYINTIPCGLHTWLLYEFHLKKEYLSNNKSATYMAGCFSSQHNNKVCKVWGMGKNFSYWLLRKNPCYCWLYAAVCRILLFAKFLLLTICSWLFAADSADDCL